MLSIIYSGCVRGKQAAIYKGEIDFFDPDSHWVASLVEHRLAQTQSLWTDSN